MDWIEINSTPITESGCWIWDGYCDPKGYGRFRTKEKNWLAHRLSYLKKHGNLPKLLRHKCDNPSCVNPSHLEPGTHTDNARDYVDRQGGNTTMFKRKIDEETRQKIREAEGTHSSIAKIFGINQSTVTRIKNGKDTNRTRYSAGG